MALGENLRAIRERRGLSQAELWRRSGVAQPSISEIETGLRGAQTRTLTKLADALGVPVAELFREETPPKVPPPPKAPLTDEPESDFDARFAATDVVSAEELQERVGAEFDALGGYIKALKAAGIEGDDLRRKQARRRLGEAKRRTRAATSRYADLALNADFGRDRTIHNTIAAYVGEAEAVAAEIEAENAETHPEAV